MSTQDDLPDAVRIGIVSISDRASSGVYEDKGLPALKEWLGRALRNPLSFEARLIPDEAPLISATLIELVDAGCSLVLTTGGTGPALRDVTPEATLAVAHKEMPGFGEQMRQISLAFVPTAILSRQVAVIRYSGFWSATNDGEHLARLQSALRAAGVDWTGEPVISRYNAPFTPWFLRRNEIWLHLAGRP